MEYLVWKCVSYAITVIFCATMLLKMVSERIDIISDLSFGEAFIATMLLMGIIAMFAFLKHHESQVPTEK